MYRLLMNNFSFQDATEKVMEFLTDTINFL